jgi:hypothetical protein
MTSIFDIRSAIAPAVPAGSAADPHRCVPGSGGIPDGLPGRLLCGDWLADLAAVVAARWPLLAVLGAAGVGARLGWAVLARRGWADHARRARWLEITPPATATPAATVQLWRLAATLLRAPRWWQWRPDRLVWEVVADAGGTRCGLWIPPGVSGTAVGRIVQRAWPGARIEHTPPPRLPAGSAEVAAHRLVVTQPEWLPLAEDPPPVTPRRRTEGGAADEEDRLRAVYDGLGAAGRTGYGLLQVHISRAPAGRVAVLRRATVDPRRACRPSLTRGLFAVVAAVVQAALDLLTPGPATRRDGTRSDPYTAQLSAQARLKLATPPHLLTAVYAAAAGPTPGAAQAACADITSGYGIFAAHLARRRLRHPRTVVDRRSVSLRRMFLLSVAEAAAFASLPAEPAAYGMPQAAARRRPASRDVWTPSA